MYCIRWEIRHPGDQLDFLLGYIIHNILPLPPHEILQDVQIHLGSHPYGVLHVDSLHLYRHFEQSGYIPAQLDIFLYLTPFGGQSEFDARPH